MNELFIIAGDYLKGKSVYPGVRRVLSLLFNISIASFIYENFYGKYTWLNYNDYKSLLNFFIKGNFFIPFSIFLIVYSATQFISVTIFWVINHFKSLKLTKEIIQYQFKKDSIDVHLQDLRKVSNLITPFTLTEELIIDVYKEIRKDITPKTFEEIENGLKAPKQNLEASFHLAFKMIIAITIYFFSLPQFGWILYLTSLIVLIIGMYILMIAYRLLDVFPTIIRMYHRRAEEYLKRHLEQTNQSSIGDK